MLTIGRIAYRQEGVFFPIDNVYISGTTRAIFVKFLMHVAYDRARSLFDTFTIGRIAYCRKAVFFPIENTLSAGKGGWECTALAKYAIYDCLVLYLSDTTATDRQTDRKTDHATTSVTIGRIYVPIALSTAMRPNNSLQTETTNERIQEHGSNYMW